MIDRCMLMFEAIINCFSWRLGLIHFLSLSYINNTIQIKILNICNLHVFIINKIFWIMFLSVKYLRKEIKKLSIYTHLSMNKINLNSILLKRWSESCFNLFVSTHFPSIYSNAFFFFSYRSWHTYRWFVLFFDRIISDRQLWIFVNSIPEWRYPRLSDFNLCLLSLSL